MNQELDDCAVFLLFQLICEEGGNHQISVKQYTKRCGRGWRASLPNSASRSPGCCMAAGRGKSSKGSAVRAYRSDQEAVKVDKVLACLPLQVCLLGVFAGRRRSSREQQP